MWAAVDTWGHRIANREIVIFSDNKTTIEVWQSGSCTDKLMMAVIRAIFFKAAKHNFNIVLSYLPGKDNTDADLLSRFQVHQFLQRNPEADWEPTIIAEETWTLRGTI